MRMGLIKEMPLSYQHLVIHLSDGLMCVGSLVFSNSYLLSIGEGVENKRLVISNALPAS